MKYILLAAALIWAAAAFSAEESDTPELNANTDVSAGVEKVFVVYNEGFAASWVTRIITQETRSNFVWQDTLLGAYFSIHTRNLRPFDITVRLSAYYPLVSTFNKHPQSAATPLHFALDLYAAPILHLSIWDYVFVNLSAGPHFFFQNADRWNYIHLGMGALVGFELPVARRWTILIDGMASLDYGNLGANSTLEPFDHVWQYQVSLGVRYSKKGENRYSYIP